MLLYSEYNSISEYNILNKSSTHTSASNNNLRKEMRSPRTNLSVMNKTNTGGFFFAPLRGTLTVEAAFVLPLFLFAMITALQYGRCMETAVQFGTALADTGKSMAVSAYISRYGGDASEITEAAAGALSAAYAKGQVLSKTSNKSVVRNTNMLLSSFLKEDDMIKLVLTYQIRAPFTNIRIPWHFMIQTAAVRGWTGRELSSGKSDPNENTESSQYVYVTITGSVYHEDSECTHLKLSVREVSSSAVSELRNNNGGIYHICEKCGNFGSSTVYITNEGNRYHSSLSCSSLKRTVRKISREEVSQMRACSKCGTH